MTSFLRLRTMQRAGVLLLLLSTMSACGGGGDGPAAPTTVTAVAVTPGSLALQGLGSSGTVAASLTPSAATGSVSWRTADPSIATVVGSGNSATVTAVAGGTTTVIATVGTISGNATVTVTPLVRAITASPTAVLSVGGSTRITPTITADAGASQSVQWTTSAATIATVDATGNITGVAPGNATITVASTVAPAVLATIAVTVNFPVVTSVTVTPASPVLLPAATRQMTATVAAGAGVSTAVTWTSSAPAVATVSATGVVTALTLGTTTIRATSVANTTVSGTTVVTVASPTVRAVTLSPTTTTVAQGNTRTITATVDADAGANSALTWTSSSAGVATVSATGVITGVTPGSATITATSVLVPAVTATVTVTVTQPAPLLSWTAQPSTPPASLLNYYVYGSYSLADGTAWAVQWLQVGDRRFMRYDGTTWHSTDIGPFERLYSIGGFGNTAWVGSVTGRLAQLSVSGSGEQTWTPMTSPTSATIVRILGLSATTALATTYTRVLALNNGVWSLMAAPGIDISDIAASASNNIVVSGPDAVAGSRVRRWNGTSWLVVEDPPITGYLTAIKFRGTDVVVASHTGQSAIYDGSTWTTATVPPTRAGALTEFIGSMRNCNGQLYASTYNGGRVFRLNGSTWNVVADHGAAIAGSSNGEVSCGADNVLRSTGGWGSIGRYTGTSWVNEVTSARISRIVIVRPDLAWASGGQGRIMRWDGARWTLQFSDATAGSSDDNELQGLSVAPDGTVMAARGDSAGQSGALYRRNTNGTWTTDVTSGYCNDVFAASATFALAVGKGCSLRWNGTAWTTVSGAPPTPMSIAGTSATNAIAVGLNDAFSASALWNGTTWTTLTTPHVGALRQIRMTAPNVAYALGDQGIIKWNGTAWSQMSLPIDLSSVFPLRAISVNSENEVYVITSGAVLWRYNGAAWENLLTVNAALGDASQYGPRSLATIPGYGVIGTGSGFLLHASTAGAVRAGISIPGLRAEPSVSLPLNRSDKNGPASGQRRRPPA